MDDSLENDEHQKNIHVCLGLIFEMFTYILQSNFSYNKLILSENFYMKIFEFCNKWLVSELAGHKAIHLVATVIELGKIKCTLAKTIIVFCNA